MSALNPMQRAGWGGRARWAALLFAFVAAASGCGSTAVWRPAPVAFSPAVARTIGYRMRVVLAAEGWTVVGDAEAGALEAGFDSEVPRTVVAQRSEEARSALVRLTLTGDELRIEYVDSWNLGYSNTTGSAVIDRTYNRWVRSLREALAAAFVEPGA